MTSDDLHALVGLFLITGKDVCINSSGDINDPYLHNCFPEPTIYIGLCSRRVSVWYKDAFGAWTKPAVYDMAAYKKIP